MKRATAPVVLFATAVAAVPLIASAQGYCWTDCPADALRVCTGIILDDYCVDNPTQAQRDRYKAQQQAVQDRQAREAGERLAREAEFRRQVDVEVARLGENRRAEAERFVRMRQDAEAARARALAPAPRPTPTRQCTQRQGVQPVSATAATREAAQASVARARATPGGSETIIANSVSGASCTQRTVADMPRPPIGTCLACITQQQAVVLGYEPGKGWPPPRIEWVCTASVTYTAERCGSGSSAVSAQ